MTALLEVDNLTGGYRDTNVLFSIFARIEAGTILGVVGRNGVGKTTLCRLVQGGLPPSEGDIRLGGLAVGNLPAHARRALGIGYMPQTSMVFDKLTVQENLAIGKNRENPDRYFERFPMLTARLDRPAGTMSGGERKILAFVRTMVEDTKLLVLDEPSEGVQPENIEHMIGCLKQRVDSGAAVLLCEQNLRFLTRLADWYLGLDTGKVILDRPSGAVSIEELRKVLIL